MPLRVVYLGRRVSLEPRCLRNTVRGDWVKLVLRTAQAVGRNVGYPQQDSH
jgi:hypothetical protein